MDAIGLGVSENADLIVLPELATSGYVFTSLAEARALAVHRDDSLMGKWAAALAGSDGIVVGGFAEVGDDGLLYNSAAVVANDGMRAVYRKTHLWDTEKLYFTPGTAAPEVLDLPFGRLGVAICYDLEFPEIPRQLALAGADVLAVPTAWPLVEHPAGEHPPEVVIAMAAARVNNVPIACADRCGIERGFPWTGGTSIIDERGWVVAARSDAGPVTAAVDLNKARNKQISERNHLFADRRPELYQ